MKVLVLNGSPKGASSNTMHLTRAFLQGAGWADAEIIHAARADIKGCSGCFSCWNKTPGTCVIHDDMAEILHKIIDADVIVWSFPLYYFSVPGSLKNLIDRQLPLNLPFMAEKSENGSHPPRYDLTDQKHIVISTCGFWTSTGNYDAVTSMFDHFCGKGRYTTIFCGQGELFRVPELKSRTDGYLEIVRKAGAQYVSGGIDPKTQAEIDTPLFPRDVFEKAADASWGISKSEDSGIQTDDSLLFITQMAAFYQPDGAERVLEFFYTDLNKTYQILLTKQGAEVITDGFKPYTTRIETPFKVWRAISRNEISGQEALFQHMYKVLGDFNLMLQWDQLFPLLSPGKTEEEKAQRKTSMIALLLPWLVIWSAMAADPVIGGSAGIIAASLTPLFWLVFRPVVYEQVSIPITACLSLAALLGADTRLVIPGSYLLFGLMWILGAFARIPLTARYSAGSYGGETAFSNPLFVKINRILTAAWGALYLITPIWTYLIMGTGFSTFIGLINSVMPALMGIFTAWFQKWYPARYARS
ncbi:MAG: flavodoxin family protein [Lacrimispora sp.]|uniref:flavodoxin family protein n=1 Tax=Lacrimispora sp. TaxID=2719234 RepID=UPI0039E4A791